MAKQLIEEIEIPEGVEVVINGNEIAVKKNSIELKKELPKVLLDKKDNKILIKTEKSTKRERKQVNTVMAHIQNLLNGLEEKFTYNLKICAVHFPMTVKVEGNFVSVKNFLGEITLRKAKILKGVDVKIDGQTIIVESHDREAAGQTAANIEKCANQRTKDKRIFQDGIFITKKAGRDAQ